MLRRIDAPTLFNQLSVVLAFVIPLSLAGANLILGLMLVVGVAMGGWRERLAILRHERWVWMMGAFLLLSALSILWSENRVAGWIYTRDYYHLLYLPILFVLIDRRFMGAIFSAFLLAMVISEIVSYLIYFDLIPHWKASWSSIDPSPFMHHTPYSLFLIFSIFLMISRLLYEKRHLFQTLLYSLFILTMSANLFINAGRTGQLLFLVVLFIFLMVNYKMSWWKTLLAGSLISALVFSIAYTLSPNFEKRMVETYSTFHYVLTEHKPLEDSTGWRFMMWAVGAQIIQEHPMLGVGIGDERDMYRTTLFATFPHFTNDVVTYASDFHNSYIKVLVQTGIIGLLLFVGIFVALFQSLSAEREAQLVGSMLLSIVIFYMMIGNFPGHHISLLFVLILAFVLQEKSDDATL